jgi:hypothetical protein
MNDLNIILLLFAIISLYLINIFILVLSKGLLIKLQSLIFAVLFIENIIGVPSAYLGYEYYAYMIGNILVIKYLLLVLFAMISYIISIFFVSNLNFNKLWFYKYKELKISAVKLYKLCFNVSIIGIGLNIYLALDGYSGYFINAEYLDKPPLWLDSVRLLSKITFIFLFIMVILDNSISKNLSIKTKLIVVLWMLVGFMVGFKFQVILPIIFIILGGILFNNFKISNVILLFIFIFLSYEVIEPLREVKSIATTNLIDSIQLAQTNSIGLAVEDKKIFNKFIERIDYTDTAISALESDDQNGLSDYVTKLKMSYYFTPLLALVPRFLWSEKPLFDHGRELSILITGNFENSITPSLVLNAYFAFGYFGILLNFFFAALFTTIAAKLFIKIRFTLIYNIPLLLIIVSFIIPDAFLFNKFIDLIRILIIISIFYAIAAKLKYLK